jgi:anti-sigma B factor antagonist
VQVVNLVLSIDRVFSEAKFFRKETIRENDSSLFFMRLVAIWNKAGKFVIAQLDTRWQRLENQLSLDYLHPAPPGQSIHPGDRHAKSGSTGMNQQPGRRRRVEVQMDGDVAIVNFVDKKILDDQNIQNIGDDLFKLVDEQGHRKILLNFSNVEFLSSAALGKLITMNRKVQAVKGKLVLCGISKSIREVFEITKLDKLFVIRDKEPEALQEF